MISQSGCSRGRLGAGNQEAGSAAWTGHLTSPHAFTQGCCKDPLSHVCVCAESDEGGGAEGPQSPERVWSLAGHAALPARALLLTCPDLGPPL